MKLLFKDFHKNKLKTKLGQSKVLEDETEELVNTNLMHEGNCCIEKAINKYLYIQNFTNYFL